MFLGAHHGHSSPQARRTRKRSGDARSCRARAPRAARMLRLVRDCPTSARTTIDVGWERPSTEARPARRVLRHDGDIARRSSLPGVAHLAGAQRGAARACRRHGRRCACPRITPPAPARLPACAPSQRRSAARRLASRWQRHDATRLRAPRRGRSRRRGRERAADAGGVCARSAAPAADSHLTAATGGQPRRRRRADPPRGAARPAPSAASTRPSASCQAARRRRATTPTSAGAEATRQHRAACDAPHNDASPPRRLGATKTGGDLLSRALASQVPSALRGLTSLFGMGRGVSPSP